MDQLPPRSRRRDLDAVADVVEDGDESLTTRASKYALPYQARTALRSCRYSDLN